MYIAHPHSWWLAKLFFQPKYKACVLKMQLGITLSGEIILWSGPHLGTTSDITIWELTWHLHPFHPWERWLADLGYVGANGLWVKFKEDQVTTRAELLYNNVHEFVRNRVEQIVSVTKNHRMFKKGIYQGTYEYIESCLVITGHTTAFELRQYTPRFECYGPWWHN